MLALFATSIYFLCLDTKKVTKKNKGKHDRSARFGVLTRTFVAFIGIVQTKCSVLFRKDLQIDVFAQPLSLYRKNAMPQI
jgi:hypothetical protein